MDSLGIEGFQEASWWFFVNWFSALISILCINEFCASYYNTNRCLKPHSFPESLNGHCVVLMVVYSLQAHGMHILQHQAGQGMWWVEWLYFFYVVIQGPAFAFLSFPEPRFLKCMIYLAALVVLGVVVFFCSLPLSYERPLYLLPGVVYNLLSYFGVSKLRQCDDNALTGFMRKGTPLSTRLSTL